MLLKEEDKETIIGIAKRFGVRRIWLFGSALDGKGEPNDIDLAVEGVPKGKLLRFYAELEKALPQSIDLVPMDLNPPIAVIVRKKGRVIYG